MLNSYYPETKEDGVSEYVDSKSRTHIVKHSVILADSENCELEQRIAEDLYRIFTKDKKASV